MSTNESTEQKILSDGELRQAFSVIMNLNDKHHPAIDNALSIVNEQKQAHADMVIGQDQPVAYLSSNPSESIEPMVRNELRRKMRLRNQTGDKL